MAPNTALADPLRYFHFMKTRLLPAALALIAACSLAACSASPATSPTPAVTGVSVSVASDMSRQLCSDLDTRSYKDAISRMATRAGSVRLSSADQDAILEHAATLCPRTMAKAAP